jgi:hypothetical protein
MLRVVCLTSVGGLFGLCLLGCMTGLEKAPAEEPMGPPSLAAQGWSCVPPVPPPPPGPPPPGPSVQPSTTSDETREPTGEDLGAGGYGRIHGLGRIDTGTGAVGGRRGRPGTCIRMSGGRSRITGSCERDDIARVMRRLALPIRSCYQRRVNPDLQGKITARWQITIQGRVGSVSTTQDTLRDSAVTACIMRVLRRRLYFLTLPRRGGGSCTVQWPFEFRPM